MATLQFPGPSGGDGLGKSRQVTADLRDLIEAVVAVCFSVSVCLSLDLGVVVMAFYRDNHCVCLQPVFVYFLPFPGSVFFCFSLPSVALPPTFHPLSQKKKKEKIGRRRSRLKFKKKNIF